jgi:hypothetical protein
LGDDIVEIELLPLVLLPCTPLMADLSMVILVTLIVFVVVELPRLVSTCSTLDEELSVDELTFTSIRLSSLSLAVEDDIDTPPSAIVMVLLR